MLTNGAYKLKPSNAHGRLTVVVADDDPNMLMLLEAVLASHLDCRFAQDGISALAMIRQSPPDVVIVDVNMPEMDGFQLLREIREDTMLNYLPVILLTAADSVGEIQIGRDLRATDYILKPIRAITLLQRIRRAIAAPRA